MKNTTTTTAVTAPAPKVYEYVRKTFTYDGQKYYVRGKTDEEAISNKLAKLAELEAGKAAYASDKNILFREYATRWLDTHNRGVASTTRKNTEYRLRKHILPKIGHLRVKDITRSEIIGVLNQLEGLSLDTVIKTRQTITRILQAAYDDGFLQKVPNVYASDLPDCKEAESRRPITPYERELTEKVAAYHHGGGYIMVMLYCGLRPQEAAALQGRHIDRKKMQITVEQARKRDNTIGTTKSKSGKRIVPIPEKLLPYLPETEPFTDVFTSTKGQRLTVSNARKLWLSFKREMNIVAGCRTFQNKRNGVIELVPPYPVASDLTPYLYRHTFCCDCVTAGIPIDLLKDLAGHRDISVTSRFYVHMTDERRDNAAAALNRYHASHSSKAI